MMEVVNASHSELSVLKPLNTPFVVWWIRVNLHTEIFTLVYWIDNKSGMSWVSLKLTVRSG